MKILIISLLLLSQRLNCEDLTKYVNPFIGTGGHGHTYPGATVPFGMVQLSPDTRLTGWDGCSAYHDSDTVVFGFSHTHLSGTGCSDYGDILIMPMLADIKDNFEFDNEKYSSIFSKKNEIASPSYYSTFLEKYKIKAELSATKRTGNHRYTFPNNSRPRILIDLKHRDDVIDSKIQIIGDTMLTGYRYSKAWAKDQRVFFAIKFSKRFSESFYNKNIPKESTNQLSTSKSNDLVLKRGDQSVNGKDLKFIFDFNAIKTLEVRVGISAVDELGAIKNLEEESLHLTFDEIVENGNLDWNRELSRIEVESIDADKKITFYTALYHTFVVPNIYSDVDGRYRGRDNKIHKTDYFDYYTVFSLWDTYRATHPLYSIIQQKRTNDFINTFLKQYEQAGLLPVWELSSNETFCMIGYHSVSVITDAYIKGINNFDVELAYKAIKHSADTNLFGLDFYKKNLFLSSEAESESVSKTLEYAYNDWCIAQMALSLSRTDDYKRFIQRAQSYKNLFDKESEFIRPRFNGGFLTPFDPTQVDNNYTEANCWQYNFYVPQDISTFIKMNGGKEKFSAKLNELFETESKLSGREQADITGLIGQYAHGNEPSHQIAYLYNFCSKPWLTQKRIHQIQYDFYKNSPDGLIGNEDCGQMSAWYVLSSMGFYPVCPGNKDYTIGTPLFSKLKINLENGKNFIIKANNLSDSNYYIQSVILNGKTYAKSFINHDVIINGGELIFEMGKNPNSSWGTGEGNFPINEISDYKIINAPTISPDKQVFRKSLLISYQKNPDSQIRYTCDGSEPTEMSYLYKEPFAIDSSVTLKAASFTENGKSESISSKYYKISNIFNVDYKTKYLKQYTGGGDDGLIDGIRGDKNFRLGHWQGFQNCDFEAIVDLSENRQVISVAAGFLQDVDAWIWMPVEIEFYISQDKIEFKKVGTIKNEISEKDLTKQIKDFKLKISEKCRYIKLIARNRGKIPDWHAGKGEMTIIFIDEIIIE